MCGSQFRQRSFWNPRYDCVLVSQTSVSRNGVRRSSGIGSDAIAAKSAPCMSVLTYGSSTSCEIDA